MREGADGEAASRRGRKAPPGSPRAATLSREERVLAACAGAAVLLTVLQWAGLPPVVLSALVIVMWLVAGTRRWGLALASGVVAVGWTAAILVAQSLTPLVGVDARVGSSIVILAAGAAVVPFARRVAPERAARPDAGAVLAAAAGPALWLAGLAMGARPGGGGLAWAMYRDSTMDLWVMRQIVEYRGIPSLGRLFIAQPPPHALSVAMTNPRASIATSPDSAMAFLVGHASGWIVTLSLSAFLGGTIVIAMAWRAGGSPAARWSVRLGAALASTLMMSFPLAGVPMDLGQTNVPMLLALLLASVAAALGARDRLVLLAVSVELASAAVIVAAWPPLASVPTLLAAALAWRSRSLHASRDTRLAWTLPGIFLFGWSLAVYGMPVIAALARWKTAYMTEIATTTTHENPGHWESYTNPYSYPLAGVLVLALVVLTLLTWRVERVAAVTAVATVAALAAAFATAVGALGGVPAQLPYFPAKMLYIATAVLVPLAVALVTRAMIQARSDRIVASLALAAVVATASVEAVRAPLDAWAPPPLLIARGAHFGTDADVVRPFVENASSEELRLPWRHSPPHDTTVALMMSSVGPAVHELVLQGMRAVLRTERGDFSTPVACDLARAEQRPLVLITRDAALEAEVAALCPEEGIRVELDPR